MKKKVSILVTGANGQLGLALRDMSIQKKEWKWIFLDSRELDVTDANQVAKTLKNYKIDYCINCAAFTNVDLCEKLPEKAIDVNGNGPKHLSINCKANGVKLIHISTDYVFNGEKKEPYTELDEPKPINIYGKSKLLGEENIQRHLDNYLIIRTSWLYSEYGNNFMKTAIKRLKAGEDLNVVDNQIGSPTSCASLSRFIIQVIEDSSLKGLCHYTDSVAISWFEFAKSILEILVDKNIVVGKLKAVRDYPSLAKRPNYSVLDTTKSKSYFLKDKSWKKELLLAVNNYFIKSNNSF